LLKNSEYIIFKETKYYLKTFHFRGFNGFWRYSFCYYFLGLDDILDDDIGYVPTAIKR